MNGPILWILIMAINLLNISVLIIANTNIRQTRQINELRQRIEARQ